MAEQWEFVQDEQQLWHWTRLDENSTRTESAKAFAKQLDCYIDAVRHAVRARRPDPDADGAGQPH